MSRKYQSVLWSTMSGKPLNSFLDSRIATHGSAVGLWHLVLQDRHFVFAEEMDARDALESEKRAVQRFFIHDAQGRATETPVRVWLARPTPKLRDGASGRTYRGEEAGEYWLSDHPRGWSAALYQRTQEMERGRDTERRKQFDTAVAEAQATFAAKGPLWTDTWEGLLSKAAWEYGLAHGLLERRGGEVRWIS